MPPTDSAPPARSLGGAVARFAGRVAVVTGAGSGIGQATAVRLASEGATIVAVDVDADGLAATAALSEKAAPDAPAVVTTVGDVADRSFAPALVDDVIARHGRLDVL